MSEKEKTITEKIAKLPAELQNTFVAQLDGAIMALDTMQAEKPAPDGDEKAS